MKIAGLQKLSLIDYPGKISAVIFTQGCNFRCGYCHNRQLVYPELFKELYPWQQVYDFLQKRKDLLEGVVISGGEPTLQGDLRQVCKVIKDLGYLLKLDTNGSNPKIISELIQDKLLDFIAMDIKAPLSDKYDQISGTKIKREDILLSIQTIQQAGINYQFRTTYDRNFFSKNDLEDIQKLIKKDKNYLLQEAAY